ncbi:hypothetical protein ACF9IK_01415 [Kitasatospora hibisci]|uniref:hypothetical protein n=1 Tax=Kitasatospora hibisci TaxID=3369522 RepID=UPI0037550D82
MTVGGVPRIVYAVTVPRDLPGGYRVVATNTYDESTGRLLTQYIDKQTSTTGTVQNTTYAYNQAGQITAIRTIPNNTPRRPTCSASPTTTSAASPPRGATPAASTSPPPPSPDRAPAPTPPPPAGPPPRRRPRSAAAPPTGRTTPTT